MAAKRRLERQGFVADRPPRPPPDPKRFDPPPLVVQARWLETCAKLGIPPDTPPRLAAWAVLKQKRPERDRPPMRRKERAWSELREGLAGRRTPLQIVAAAEALGLGPKEALKKAEEGWGPSGPPREPGDDREEDAERVA